MGLKRKWEGSGSTITDGAMPQRAYCPMLSPSECPTDCLHAVLYTSLFQSPVICRWSSEGDVPDGSGGVLAPPTDPSGPRTPTGGQRKMTE